MKKLLAGILEFHDKVRPGVRERFAKLALGQRPDALMFVCSDSRVAPNVFASTDPGDMFVVRNVGNLVPCCESHNRSSEAAALEFALKNLNIKDIIVCGHSSCGAIQAILAAANGQGIDRHVADWVHWGEPSLRRLRRETSFAENWPEEDRLSQINVLEQLEHLCTYPEVQERLAKGNLRLHAWWFHIAEAEVYAYDKESKEFRVLDEEYVRKHK